jgi:hypothetical protein
VTARRSAGASERLEDRLRVVAHLPGRLRVRAETFRVLPEVANDVLERVRREPGVSSASSSEVTGSLLVIYDPSETQILRLLRTIVHVGGLAGIEVDHVDGEPQKAPGDRVRNVLGELDARMRQATSGTVDLRTAVPGTLALLGLRKLVLGGGRVPEWYDLLFWSFVTFSNLNPRSEPRGSEEPTPASSGNGGSPTTADG